MRETGEDVSEASGQAQLATRHRPGRTIPGDGREDGVDHLGEDVEVALAEGLHRRIIAVGKGSVDLGGHIAAQVVGGVG
jgi:hypothetical protein